MRQVVSAVIVREGRLLLTQRRPSQDFPLRWETPGGKVEPSDGTCCSIRDGAPLPPALGALTRELAEEIGLRWSRRGVVDGCVQLATTVGEVLCDATAWLGVVFCGSGLESDPPAIREPLRVSMYRVRLPPGELVLPREGQGIGWFGPVEVAALPMAPANERCRVLLADLADGRRSFRPEPRVVRDRNFAD